MTWFDGLDPMLFARTLVGIAAMVAVVMLLLRWAGVHLGVQPVTAVARAIGQLGLASVILSGALSMPWLIAAVLLLMLLTASGTSAGRLRGLPGGREAAVLGVVTGGVVATSAVLALGVMPLTSRNVLAIGGIIIGNAMTAATLAGRHFRTLARERSGEVEAWWGLGATSPIAYAQVAREAVTDAMIPNLDQTRSTGVVTLPGAFIGALFGGASPLEAARFQVVVLTAIMLAQTVTALTVTRRLSRMTRLPAEG
ncbi:ABC transporter permease [Brachybacterium sp. EF45031]|uniref:ABC transporter permease n=1 Tax=Brachybacterium sillae TaxID=2810536 RepID=UPI00217CEC52|nr:ABC transporter permease [Brachybacterium sillae]MCS6711807.1 ABC transporter permease [Brachybacterium sillae]